jgi:hypothetical protein
VLIGADESVESKLQNWSNAVGFQGKAVAKGCACKSSFYYMIYMVLFLHFSTLRKSFFKHMRMDIWTTQ